MDVRPRAARGCAGSCTIACGTVNQAHLWRWQIACDVQCCACCVDRPADSLPHDIDALRALASTAIPLYRQAKMLAAQGLDLDRSTLAFWVGYAAAELVPLYERLKTNLLTSAKLAVDETPVPVLDPGRSRAMTGPGAAPIRRLWSIPTRRVEAASRAQHARDRHAIAGRLDHHLVRRPQALAKPFKCSPCHVDPAGMSKDAILPIAKCSVN